MNAIRPALLAAALGACGAAYADDCKFNQGQYAEYKAVCRQTDGCASDAQMRKIVTDSCGAAASTPSARQPASRKGDAAGNADSTAEGGGTVPTISVKPKPVTGISLPKDVSHEGKWCTYFNGRPSVESGDGTMRLNWYAKGAKVCHGKWLYVCGDDMKWKIHSWCPANGKQSEEYEAGL